MNLHICSAKTNFHDQSCICTFLTSLICSREIPVSVPTVFLLQSVSTTTSEDTKQFEDDVSNKSEEQLNDDNDKCVDTIRLLNS